MLSTLTLRSQSAAATARLAARLAKKLPGGSTLCLVGPIGAGKTTFAQGFLRALGVAHVASPTFVVARKARVRRAGLRAVIHADLYRLPPGTDIRELGLSEAMHDPHTVVLIEWADRLRGQLPGAHRIIFSVVNKSQRQLTLSAGLRPLLAGTTTRLGRPRAARQSAASRPRLASRRRRPLTSRRSTK